MTDAASLRERAIAYWISESVRKDDGTVLGQSRYDTQPLEGGAAGFDIELLTGEMFRVRVEQIENPHTRGGACGV